MTSTCARVLENRTWTCRRGMADKRNNIQSTSLSQVGGGPQRMGFSTGFRLPLKMPLLLPSLLGQNICNDRDICNTIGFSVFNTARDTVLFLHLTYATAVQTIQQFQDYHVSAFFSFSFFTLSVNYFFLLIVFKCHLYNFPVPFCVRTTGTRNHYLT